MPWQPPIPSGVLYSPPALALGPGLALLAWCYDRVERDGVVTIRLEQAAADIGRPYGTIRDWWALLKRGPFFTDVALRGKLGWRATFQPHWLDWRVMAQNYPLPNVTAERGDLAGQQSVAPVIAACSLPNVTAERGDLNGDPLHEGTHDSRPSMHADAAADASAALHRASTENPTEPAPSPAAFASILNAAAAWLGRALTPAERIWLSTAVQTYSADWVTAGIAESTASGGRTLSYLRIKLDAWRTAGRMTGPARRKSDYDRRDGTSQPTARVGTRATYGDAPVWPTRSRGGYGRSPEYATPEQSARDAAELASILAEERTAGRYHGD